jgi:hypothetical protein
MTRSQVANNIYANTLSIYWVSDHKSTAPRGTVISEIVAYNSNPIQPQFSHGPVTARRDVVLGLGSELGLTVSGGPANVVVPNTVGQAKSAAMTNISKSGFVPRWQDGCSAGSAEYAVIAQSPNAGSRVQPNSTITIIINDQC